MVEIPRDRFDQENDEDRGPGYEAVLFRHADPNVMMGMIPSLYPEQIARLFGHAKTIIIDAPDYATVRTFDMPPDVGPAQSGMLRIATNTQYEAIADAREETSRANIDNYLRETAPEYVAILTDFEYDDLLLEAETTGNDIGFESEHAHGLCAFIGLITGGEMFTNPHAVHHLKKQP